MDVTGRRKRLRRRAARQSSGGTAQAPAGAGSLVHDPRILLVHAAFGGVGYCETGLLQGDPLSTLVLAITPLDPLKRIQALLRADDAQANARAKAFANDVFGAGGL